MWDRGTLKYYAKDQLKQYYWIAFAVCLIYGVISGGINFSVGGSSSGANSYSGSVIDGDVAVSVLIAVLVVALFAMAIGIAVAVFLVLPLRVGLCSFFLSAPWGNREVGTLFSSFRGGRYKPIVKTMFFMELYILLWSLLFVIPGIVKSYEYRMVPYLISEYPYLTPNEAIELSRSMTDGEKWRIFVLDLSFLGWYLLGTLLLFIGTLFVTPYVEATNVQLYFALRQRVNIPPPPSYPGYPQA